MLKSFYQLIQEGLSSNAIDEEFKYFAEYARRFPNNPKSKRYGILPINSKPGWNNMIYDADIKQLRLKHLNHIHANGLNDGHKVRLFVDWLERMGG